MIGWIISGLIFYTIIIFISSTGFVTDEAEDQFGVNTELSVLGQSMFILGIAIGPMFLAPLSEVHGRQPVYTTGIFLFAILHIPAALSPTFAGLIISRFLAGCFAGIPLSNVGASAADLFPTSQTSWPIMLFSFCSQVVGPCLGPVIGSAIYVRTNRLSWLYWTCLIAGMVNFVSHYFFLLCIGRRSFDPSRSVGVYPYQCGNYQPGIHRQHHHVHAVRPCCKPQNLVRHHN